MRVFHAIPALKKRMAKTMALVTMPESRWVQKAGSFLDDLVLAFSPKWQMVGILTCLYQRNKPFINAGSDLVAHDDLKDLAIWQSEEPQIGLSEIEGNRSWLIVPLISTSCV